MAWYSLPRVIVREYTRHINIHQRNVPRSCRASRRGDDSLQERFFTGGSQQVGTGTSRHSRPPPLSFHIHILQLLSFIFIKFFNLFFFYPFILSFYFSLLLPPFLILLVSLSKIIIIIIIIISHAHYSYAHALQCLNLHTLYKGGHKLSAILFIKFHLFLKLSPSLSKFPLKIACLHQFSVGCPCTNCPASNVFSF